MVATLSPPQCVNSLAPGVAKSQALFLWIMFSDPPYIMEATWVMLGGQNSWWHHQMETFSASLAICPGNSPVPGEFPTQRPVTRSFDVYLDLRPNKWLSKQSWGRWFETLSCSLWRHRNVWLLIVWHWATWQSHSGDEVWFQYTSMGPAQEALSTCHMTPWQANDTLIMIELTNWGWDKMATVSKTTFSNAFSWMKMYEFWLKSHWSLFLNVQLTILQHWFR